MGPSESPAWCILMSFTGMWRGEEMEAADSDLTMGPGWHHGITGTSQCSHSSDLTAPAQAHRQIESCFQFWNSNISHFSVLTI